MALPVNTTRGSKISHPPHPYYPVEVEIAGYVANEKGVLELLSIFAAGCTVLFFGTYLVSKKIHPKLPGSEVITVMWRIYTSLFEGYYALNQANLGSLQTLFGQLWKEYAFSDSRYLTQNAFVLCMESITAICWGPGCYIVALMIPFEHPLRHPLQIVVSLGQLYGDILYYATSLFDHYYMGISYSRPEAYYYWGYYFLMNFFWIVIPSLLIYNSIVACADAFKAQAKLNASKKLR
ncbi:hypothetical protein H2203_000353 [Taxawa tesnikishii (nom. ined.)]|nr:hypothetical protein H2203_000353 [Dothideales sp. JES 119]